MADAVGGRIAVIVPYYQKQSGVLSRAIVSALAQADVAPFSIIIVDDASPVPARLELADIMRQHPGRIVIIEQPNAGPAAARNKGLDNVPPSTQYVAFLDSDDEWIESHLANAIAALDAGYDFYFSDHFQLNQTVSAFNRAGRIDVTRHPAITSSPHLHHYDGDMFAQILMGNIIGTSTVVYRFRQFSGLRFLEEFVYAGEDYLFWLGLCKRTSKIAFSSLCECRYGAGVNIFSGSGWGTEKSLIRLHHEMKFKKALPRLFQLSPEQKKKNGFAVQALRSSFVTDLLHRIAHRKQIEGTLLKSQLRIDPQTFIYFLPLTLKILLKL
jgi:succinoglycan biosynthesis protein ExoW